MTPETLVQNPFMLMMNPEGVVAAMENSERLNALNRHLCRPLDRPAPPGPGKALADEEALEVARYSRDV